MLVQHGRVSKTTGKKLFYYTCSLKRKSHKKLCDNGNAKADYVENLVINSLKLLSKSKKKFINGLKILYKNKLKSNETSIERLSLEKSLNEKKNQIDNLVLALSKSSEIEDILLDKIKSLKNDCVEIENKIKNIETSTKEQKLNNINLSLIESIIDECSMIDQLSRNEQKRIIDILIDTIYWYGSGNGKGKIKIKFIGADENTKEIVLSEEKLQQRMLQFYSPSTCKINDFLLSFRKTKKTKGIGKGKIYRSLCRWKR